MLGGDLVQLLRGDHLAPVHVLVARQLAAQIVRLGRLPVYGGHLHARSKLSEELAGLHQVAAICLDHLQHAVDRGADICLERGLYQADDLVLELWRGPSDGRRLLRVSGLRRKQHHRNHGRGSPHSDDPLKDNALRMPSSIRSSVRRVRLCCRVT
jgi:hypothetical protein